MDLSSAAPPVLLGQDKEPPPAQEPVPVREGRELASCHKSIPWPPVLLPRPPAPPAHRLLPGHLDADAGHRLSPHDAAALRHTCDGSLSPLQSRPANAPSPCALLPSTSPS